MNSVETNSSPQPSPFWTFSLGYYRMAAVQEACLALQDDCGVDVNIILFLLWTASQSRRLPPDQVAALIDKVRLWQADVVAPIRSLRRRLKSNPPLLDQGSAELFRTKIKAIELESERLQQEAMFTLAETLRAEPASSAEEAARANIAAYQATIGRPFEAAAVDTLIDALCRRTFGEAS
jgi:uncharacterized protein (TIGR02444 family)